MHGSADPTPPASRGDGALARRLGPADATVLGLASMLGAGVFSVFAPAAAAAGAWLLVGLAVAAVVAFANATSSAQLAATYPSSGGTYVYGRERLGPWAGFLAGWGFVVGKTASCAAMALTVATYALPAGAGTGWRRLLAVAVVVVVTATNYRGVTRTARLARILLTVTVLALTVGITTAWVTAGTATTTGGAAGGPADGTAGGAVGGAVLEAAAAPVGVYGVLQSAGLLFFAFAGYARIATLGEEVRDPARTIPRAIVTALGIALALYILVAVTLLSTLGVRALAGAAAPLAHAAGSGAAWAGPVVAVGAVAAASGALLALVAGIGRTTLAMAREADLPTTLAAVHPRFAVPHRAELAVGAAVTLLVLTVDLRSAIGFSSFGVLIYYLVANLAALTQPPVQRRYPRALPLLGIVGCITLCATLPPTAIVTGLVVFALGAIYRLARHHLSATDTAHTETAHTETAHTETAHTETAHRPDTD